MDGDDGLLLNFAAAPASGSSSKSQSRPHAKVSGGNWKERRKIQLSLEGRGRGAGKKKISDANKTKPSEVKREIRPPPATSANSTPVGLKRSFDKSNDGSSSSNDQVKSKRPLQSQSKEYTKEARGENGGKNNTYISSLFTATPDIQKRDYKEDSEIQTSLPSNAPLTDSTTFAGLGVSEFIVNHLTGHLRFQAPTKIQRSVIPRLLDSAYARDLFVQAQTGSGKTLSFVLPIFQKLTEIKELNRTTGLFAIILTPTRELANQIYAVMESMSRCCHRIVPGIVIGGEKKKSEKARLRKGVNILVATPGRLLDHMQNTTVLDLSNIRYVVLDEGDKLMEMGFEEDITNIFNKVEMATRYKNFNDYPTLPNRRINVLCSATIKADVKKLGEIALDKPELVNATNKDNIVDFTEETKAPDQLTQQILIVPPKLRLVTLSGMLKNLTKDSDKPTRTMVFFSCSDSVNFHFISLTREGKRISTKKIDKKKLATADEEENEDTINNEHVTALTAPLLNENVVVYKLHGSLSQQVRTSTLSHFTKTSDATNTKEENSTEGGSNTAKHTILLCTDVAARGLDLPLISNVIEYDPPFAIDDHLHRIGRTARAGKSGLSCLFLLPGNEENYLEKIKPFHNESQLQFKNFETVLKDAFGKKSTDDKKRSKHGKEGDWDVEATTYQLNIERWLLEEPRAHELATKGFISHLRAYTTHLSSEKDCFNIKTMHMGHLAKAFGLRETPKKLAGMNTGGGESTKKPKEDAKSKMMRMARAAYNSQNAEFNIGI